MLKVTFTHDPKSPCPVACKVSVPQGKETFTKEEFIDLVRQFEGRAVNSNTIRTWRYRIGLEADDSGLFGQDDIRYMFRYLAFKSQGITARKFIQIIEKENNANIDSQSNQSTEQGSKGHSEDQSTAHTIDTTATAA